MVLAHQWMENASAIRAGLEETVENKFIVWLTSSIVNGQSQVPCGHTSHMMSHCTTMRVTPSPWNPPGQWLYIFLKVSRPSQQSSPTTSPFATSITSSWPLICFRPPLNSQQQCFSTASTTTWTRRIQLLLVHSSKFKTSVPRKEAIHSL